MEPLTFIKKSAMFELRLNSKGAELRRCFFVIFLLFPLSS